MIGSNLIYNIIEYFSFINLFLLFLFIIIILFFILINITLLYYSNIQFNHCIVEFLSTLFSLFFLIIIISPALIILLDFDLIILPDFIIYSLGIQWSWCFDIKSKFFNIYLDHFIISSETSIYSNSNFPITTYYLSNNYPLVNYFTIITNYQLFSSKIEGQFDIIELIKNNYQLISNWLFINPYQKLPTNYLIKDFIYLGDLINYILLPIYGFIKLFTYSLDVIHSLGFYSLGIKIDAVPGRINLANSIRLLWKGQYNGKCFELCGQGHLSMMMLSNVI